MSQDIKEYNLQLPKSTTHFCTSNGYRPNSISHLIKTVALQMNENNLLLLMINIFITYVID